MPPRFLPTCLLLLGACTQDALVPHSPREADFPVRPGVETATVVGVDPGSELTLYDDHGNALLTLLADDLGQAHFAYVPDEHMVVDTNGGQKLPIVNGGVLTPGTYAIRNDVTGESSGRIEVMAVDQIGPDSLYEGQVLDGIHHSLLTGDEGDPLDAFQYIETRDGTLLSTTVRFPDPLLYGDGPYPTVIEYSGYSPSRPDRLDPGSQIANALGYATVGVNMRGTGCSGGVFDVFNRAQHADGYDIVEVVARQEWVLNGQVGMVGLSYPGISQLFVASTNPPSLAGIVPLSVIADPWEMQWPGGVYNAGFTRQWIGQRDDQAAAGGASWVVDRIEDGDETCIDNVELSAQNIDFESFLHGLEFRPRDANDRDLNRLVEQIEAAVFLGGAWQDEQTGANFGGMLDRFYSSRAAKFTAYNGRHPDGFAPDMVFRWVEFLEFYVAERVPVLNPGVRLLGAQEFANQFQMQDFEFPDDRFSAYSEDQYSDALAAYEAEQPVRVLFESGAGGPPGEPIHRFEAAYDTWPPPEAQPQTWYLDAPGLLSDSPGASGIDAWIFDPDAGPSTFFGPAGYQLMVPLWDIDWTPFAAGNVASYLTPPFAEATVLAGPGVADLWVRSPVDDVTVQMTLTEVRDDGIEVLISSGWLRLGHRFSAPTADLRLERSYLAEDFEPVPVGEWVQAALAIPSVAHPLRAGSSLQVAISSPGRNHGTWEFEAPLYAEDPTFELGRGPDHPTSLTMTTLPGIAVPDEPPPCPSLRGQPCRTFTPVDNLVVQ